MNKLFLAAILATCFVSSGAANRSSSEKIQVVYREQLDGEWKLHIYGPYCPSNLKLQMVEPKDPTEPTEVSCLRR